MRHHYYSHILNDCVDIINVSVDYTAEMLHLTKRERSPLERQACAITGAGSGLGRACPVEMPRQGAHAVVFDIDEVAGLENHVLRCVDP